MTTGIYEIRNKINGHIYIGSSSDIEKRWWRHKGFLKNGNHHSKHLQNAWNKYGEENFVFDIIMFCDEDRLLLEEQKFLDEWKPEYNICKVAGKTTGLKGYYKHSQESKIKMSKAKLGKKQSKEHRRSIGLGHLGKTNSRKVYSGLLDSNGKVYNNISNLTKFCKENELNYSHIIQVLLGNRKSHKGWTRYL